MVADPAFVTGAGHRADPAVRPHWLTGWLGWLDAALHREILRLRARYELSLDELRGLYISDEQVDRLLCRRDDADAASRELAALGDHCRERLLDLHESAGPLRDVAREFRLSDAEVRAVVIGLAPEVDLRYPPIYAYLNDDVTRRLPTVDLCLRLADGDGEAALLDPRSRLFADGLVDVVRGTGELWRAAGLALRDPVRTFLLGLDDARIDRTALEQTPPDRGLLDRRPLDLVPLAAPADCIVVVDGDDGAQTAGEVAGRQGRELVSITEDLTRPGQERALGDLLVRARLHSAVVHATLAPDPAANAVRQVLAAPVARVLSPEWRSHLGGVAHEVTRPEQVSPDGRARSVQVLESLAQRVPLGFGWDDLVLPVPTKARLHELASAIARRQEVFGEWGFRRLSGDTSSLRVLFTGSSGTGKTMSAAVLAREVGLDLFAVDVSAVVSKWIGETEKNLERIFRGGEGSGAILFFDEADALFGKRTDVSDAHDRYANIEASYLLQRMERYDGVLILATNLAANMDEAFNRRLHAEIEFPMPDESARYALWHKALPPTAPVSSGVDHEFLARQFPLSGGDIRNVALSAAFLAAHDRTPITMGHLVRSLARQRHRQGKLPTQAEFGDYLRLARTEAV